jgi:hypothetical protein
MPQHGQIAKFGEMLKAELAMWPIAGSMHSLKRETLMVDRPPQLQCSLVEANMEF